MQFHPTTNQNVMGITLRFGRALFIFLLFLIISVCPNYQEVFVAGHTEQSQLGLGNSFIKPTFFNIGPVASVEATYDKINPFHIIVMENRQVYSVGDNKFGALGINSSISSATPKHVSLLSNIVQASCGKYHVVYLDSFGVAYTTGGGDLGQCKE